MSAFLTGKHPERLTFFCMVQIKPHGVGHPWPGRTVFPHQQWSRPCTPDTFGSTFKLGDTAIAYGSVLMLALYLCMWFYLRETAAGRHVYAVGNNPEATRLTGIPTERVLLGVYVMAGVFYGIASLLSVARTGVGDPNAGQTENLDAITAVVLGGTSLFGGRGVILGTLVGAIIVGVLRNGLTLMGVQSVYQVLITGILVILAVTIDQLSRKGAR